MFTLMATYQHFDAPGLPGEGITWCDDAGDQRVGYLYLSIMDHDRTGENWRVEVWMRSESLDDVPLNVLLAALPSEVWRDEQRRLPFEYPLSVDQAHDRRAAEAAYHARVNVLAAEIAAWAGDMMLCTFLADGMPVAMALEARHLLEDQP